jgi:D-glycero-alpha-D-manno-heptose 1-phosphate guanylyltransferase
MEAIILAGGLGTRLRSVVSKVPKCMAPISGEPFLKYLLHYLSGFDISKVIISVGYLKDIIIDWTLDNSANYPFEIDFAIEDEPLGTGGGIALAMSKTSCDEILVVNGDTFFNVDLDCLSKECNTESCEIGIALKPMEKFTRYGNVLMESVKASKKKGFITEFREKEYCNDGLINGGIYILKKSSGIFEGLPEKFSFETEILKPETARKKTFGFINDNYFIDIGIPSDYERAQKELPELKKIMDIANADYTGYETLLLDRDGVINRLRPGDYVKSWDEFEFMPGIMDAMAIFSRKFRDIFIITNQRGVGKGLMSKNDLLEIHDRMLSELKSHGGRVDGIYYCTATEMNDPMRKPNTGMFSVLQKEHPDVKKKRTLMIGDSQSDMEFAKNCGISGIKL